MFNRSTLVRRFRLASCFVFVALVVSSFAARSEDRSTEWINSESAQSPPMIVAAGCVLDPVCENDCRATYNACVASKHAGMSTQPCENGYLTCKKTCRKGDNCPQD